MSRDDERRLRVLASSWLDCGAMCLGSTPSVSRSTIPDPTGKVREESANFIWPGEWSPCLLQVFSLQENLNEQLKKSYIRRHQANVVVFIAIRVI